MQLTPEDLTAVAPTTPAAPAPEPEAEVPEEVLQIPAFSAMLSGKPPAVFTPKGVSTPETKAIERNIQPLMKIGFAVYRPLDDSGSVFYNTAFVGAEELRAADEAGQLDTIAPPVTEVIQAFSGSEAAAPGPVSQPSGAPNPALEKTLNRARVQNMSAGAPTSGAAPGAGRLMNSILKTAV
jgi:hypothetical protein